MLFQDNFRVVKVLKYRFRNIVKPKFLFLRNEVANIVKISRLHFLSKITIEGEM